MTLSLRLTQRAAHRCYDEAVRLSAEERRELADRMIALWQRYKDATPDL